jgi:hypothetical protein
MKIQYKNSSSNLLLRKFVFIGIFISGAGLSAQSMTLSGQTNPCKGTGYSYNVSLSGVNCTPGGCTANGTVKQNRIEYEWSLSGGVIQSQNSGGVVVSWDCRNRSTGSNFLTCIAVCSTYTLRDILDNNGVRIGEYCEENARVLAVQTLNVTPKCPPEAVVINGPTYVPCCDNGLYSYSMITGGGDFQYEWSLPPGWSLNSGQGTSNVWVTPANGPNGRKMSVNVWPTGCDKTLAGTTGSLSITRMPQLTKTGVWPNVICSTGTVTLCVDSLPCANFQWSDSVGNFNNPTNSPSVTNQTGNGRCYTINVAAKDNDNFGFVDINLRATSPCGEQTLKHRIKVPAGVPHMPEFDWDGKFGHLCVCRRNVLFWTTYDDPTVEEWEWSFDNGSSTYTLSGQTIGTDFCDFGSSWALNPNSDVTVKVRTRNICGWSPYKTITISAARFRNISSSDCNQYPAGPAPLTAEKQEINPRGRLNITPNPASGKVQLCWAPGETGRLLVYNLNGRLVMENPKLVSGSEISLPGLPAGSYMVKVSSSNTWYVNRLLLQ